MTGRNYDVILNFSPNVVANTGIFTVGNTIIGSSSGAKAIIANVDTSANTMKVKYSNSSIKFVASENVHSKSITTRTISSTLKYSNTGTVSTINKANFAAINSDLATIRSTIKTAGNSLIGDSTNIINTFILPVPANTKEEITVFLNNVMISTKEYIWTGDLATDVEVTGSFGGSLTLESQTSFNITPFFANAIHFPNQRIGGNTNVTIRVETANLKATTFEPAVFVSNANTAVSNVITSIAPSPYIAEKNAFTQNPLVRLVKIYYPGEWYPPNSNGNPTGAGAGLSWPNDFPFKIAEINGDIISDLSYNVTFDGDSYSPYPINISPINQASDGEINEITVSVFNFENTISALVENPFIAGNNKANSAMALVNHEYVNGIDPRTINMEADEISNWSGFPNFVSSPGTTANLAANVLFGLRTKRVTIDGVATNVFNYSATAEGTYGKENAAWTYDEVATADGSSSADWEEKKLDSRDLLGAIVEIKSTFANFLDVWTEYSTVKSILGNAYELVNTMPYRVGDSVKSNKGSTEATIQGIEENRFIFLSNPVHTDTAIGDPLYIINSDADPESFIEDVFKIDSLESLNDSIASFSLTSWLQYFKFVVPKRKYYKNTCQWEYKGAECQYPGPNTVASASQGLPIPGTNLLGNTNPIHANNSTATLASQDICGKSLVSCQIRNNDIHFGGFPATGRTIPRQ